MHRADSETHNPYSVVEKQAKELNPCTQVESCSSGGSALHFLLWLTFGTPRRKGQGWGWLTPLMGKHKWLRGRRELEEDLGTSGMLSHHHQRRGGSRDSSWYPPIPASLLQHCYPACFPSPGAATICSKAITVFQLLPSPMVRAKLDSW